MGKTAALNRNVVNEEALKKTYNYKKCGLAMSMGMGKTRIGLKHMQKFFDPFVKYLVVAPKHSVFASWIDEIAEINAEDLIPHITFTTYLSINKHNPNDFDCVYLDECHSLLESHEPFLSNFKGRILGLTGTPPKRKGSEKWRMVQKYCPIIYTFTVDQAADSNILNDYKIVVHQLELSGLPTLMKKNKNGGKWYTSEKKDYSYLCERLAQAISPKQRQFSSIMRMRGIMDYTSKEEYLKGLIKNINQKCIIFANTQAQADKVCQYSYHSKNKQSEENLELFSDGRIDKLSCVLQLSEGVTIPGLKQGIIMHSYGNERKTTQRIGRLLRLNPDETAICHILCYKDTVDEIWLEKALENFDRNKVTYFNPLT
jgi:superfamily II DNA or RNA helicase|tara:strand:- start:4814 stop:5926 length:1113 start_codon:yes stop_codon:yes gene_type:complete